MTSEVHINVFGTLNLGQVIIGGMINCVRIQQTTTCSKLTIEKLEKVMKYVQS